MAYQHPGPGSARPTVVFTRAPAPPTVDADDDLVHFSHWGGRAWSFLRSCLIFALLLYFFGHACSCSDAQAAPTDPPADDEIARFCNDGCLGGIQRLCDEYGFPPGSEACNCGLLVCEAACECAIVYGEEACQERIFATPYCMSLLDPTKTD